MAIVVLIWKQIEQFIESIFPTQDPKAIVGNAIVEEKPENLSAEEAENRKLAAKDAKWDMIYMGMAVLGVFILMSSLMVSSAPLQTPPMLTQVQFFLAWMLGARFDLMFKNLSSGNLSKPSVDDLNKLGESVHREL